MSGFFDKLKQKIFDSKSDKEWSKEAQVAEPKKTSPKSLSKKSESPTKTSRDPYFIQIGFDFGTSSSKVVCRDVIIDKAWVIPLGSGHIERIASGANGTVDWNELEKWRLLKEAGETHPRLMEAKQQIGGSLTLRSKQTIHFAKVKLQRRAQINDLKVIFGGGGHSEQPYAVSVLRQFDEPETFRADLIKKRRYDRDVFELGMPVPSDLGLKSKEKRWAGRLSVAYGLAFERSQLAAFKLPGDVITLKSPIRRRKLPYAPTKDDC